MFEARVRGVVQIEDSTRELKVHKGQVVKVSDIAESGWAYCTAGGKEGWVPCSCIEPTDYEAKTSPNQPVTSVRPRRAAPKPKRASISEPAVETAPQKEAFPFGTKFNPNTGEKIPKFDPETGRRNW
mmetsp:Transcript_26933/g.37599  ORF Transcript_26933/g.37599 Transcript_26933/m.37599 type:complete len:127 (-) Transcript_26933:531-911(-)|eukprot:CAMPEP_0185251602 /NCGR_PEP_ID=MMETSP1359-20130426/973_1 /TAXON_ID=552665 /ORGANISM="Bigelowiella longifila, Strain CCMP242" /LENGTH=126 /DNA_ID=CAMNT_0027833565 /DNA_START=79 /DNA_END=459 /DNA_ORIENTATION=+